MNNLLSDIRNDFMNCTTVKEVDALVFQYSEVLDENRALYVCAKLARRRIHNLRREKLKSYNLILN